MPRLFDPLRYLRDELHVEARIGPKGVVLTFDRWARPEDRQKARRVLEVYKGLLRLQIENGGASVQKLLAQGKIRLEGRMFRWGRGE